MAPFFLPHFIICRLTIQISSDHISKLRKPPRSKSPLLTRFCKPWDGRVGGIQMIKLPTWERGPPHAKVMVHLHWPTVVKRGKLYISMKIYEHSISINSWSFKVLLLCSSAYKRCWRRILACLDQLKPWTCHARGWWMSVHEERLIWFD